MNTIENLHKNYLKFNKLKNQQEDLIKEIESAQKTVNKAAIKYDTENLM